jgi:hypothetical protein
MSLKRLGVSITERKTFPKSQFYNTGFKEAYEKKNIV